MFSNNGCTDTYQFVPRCISVAPHIIQWYTVIIHCGTMGPGGQDELPLDTLTWFYYSANLLLGHHGFKPGNHIGPTGGPTGHHFQRLNVKP